MEQSQNPLMYGFTLGRWFDTDVRVSVWFPLIALTFCFRLGLRLGLITTLLLIAIILVHEMFHVFAARWTGGEGNEVILWPLGGLAFVSPAASFQSEFWTPAAGPVSHVLMCLLSLPVVLYNGMLMDSLNPIMLPPVFLENGSFLTDLVILFFSLNFKLLILNLLPIHPLDGSRMASSVVGLYIGKRLANSRVLWTGIVLCFLILTAGLMLESTEFVFIGFVLVMLSMNEYTTTQIAERFGDMYEPESWQVPEEREPQLGPIARWRAQREEKKRVKAANNRRQTAQRVDELLEKVHNEGMDALSDAERKFLKNASTEYRAEDDPLD